MELGCPWLVSFRVYTFGHIEFRPELDRGRGGQGPPTEAERRRLWRPRWMRLTVTHGLQISSFFHFRTPFFFSFFVCFFTASLFFSNAVSNDSDLRPFHFSLGIARFQRFFSHFSLSKSHNIQRDGAGLLLQLRCKGKEFFSSNQNHLTKKFGCASVDRFLQLSSSLPPRDVYSETLRTLINNTHNYFLGNFENLQLVMAHIQKFQGTTDEHWDCYADFATELNDEFNKLGLRDEIRLDRYASYLEGEALGFYNYLRATIHFSSYDEMCNTLSTEFTKLELQMKAYANKKKLDALVWDQQQMNVRDFADTIRSHVQNAFPLIDKAAQEELMIFYLREKSGIQLGLPMWLKYSELVKTMVKALKN